MKIRRTLPSVNEYSPMNRKSRVNNVDQNKTKEISVDQDNMKYQTLKKINSSPQKRIFGLERNSSQPKNELEIVQRKKTVSFVNSTDIKIDQNYPEYERSPKRQRKSRIFRYESKNKKNGETIPTHISIKQLSQQLKKSRQYEVEEKIIKKIEHLEDLVNGMSEKVRVSEVQQIKVPQQKLIKNFSQIDNTVLKLQLEQMRRCEKIAKENEILYGKLIRNIEVNQNQLMNSRRRTNSHYQSSHHNLIHSQNETAKITAFEDFEQYERKNHIRDLDESEAQLQIASPFSLEENKGRVKFAK